MKLPPISLSDITDPTLRDNVSTIVANYLSNNQTISFLKSEQETDKQTLNKLLDSSPYAGRSIVSDNFRLTTSTKKTKTIDAAILLQLGVSMDVIKQATVEKESQPYWTISELKNKNNNKEDYE